MYVRFVDIVINGEGEAIFTEFLKCYLDKGSLEEIKGMSYIDYIKSITKDLKIIH